MQKVCLELLNNKKINLNLYEEYAPITVANFLHLIDIHFYDGLIFHRVIKGFIGQGGAYYIEDNSLKTRNVNYTIPGEFINNGFDNQIQHTAGVISMARTDNPNSGNTQFFICDADTPSLDGQYAAFGIVSDDESFDVLHEICALPTTTLQEDLADFPNVDDYSCIIIKTITRVDA